MMRESLWRRLRSHPSDRAPPVWSIKGGNPRRDRRRPCAGAGTRGHPPNRVGRRRTAGAGIPALVRLVVALLADGAWLTVPVQVFVGSRPRPRCVAIAGVHGDEPDGMLALLDFAAQCDPARLRGTVVLVPVANPPSLCGASAAGPLGRARPESRLPGPGQRHGVGAARLPPRDRHPRRRGLRLYAAQLVCGWDGLLL
jgi:hypothetical protein